MTSAYGQFCPVAVASEVFAERWTPLILRELYRGSHRFNDIHRGLPRISKALLVRRLRTLEDAAIVLSVARSGAQGHEYRLTAAGVELCEVVVQLGHWGQRWTAPVRRDRLDARLLMWDMRRRIALDRLPARRIVAQFDFRGVPMRHRHPKTYWLLLDREVDLCIVDPGHEVDLFVEADLAVFVRVWLGQIPMREAIRCGDIRLSGSTEAIRGFPSWLLLSTLAAIPRPGNPTQRRVA
jgi:DNA-binding HxlR family transcriptional regulator